MVNIGGNGDLPQGDALSNDLWIGKFLLRDGFHFRGDDALFRRFHLGCIFSHRSHPFPFSQEKWLYLFVMPNRQPFMVS